MNDLLIILLTVFIGLSIQEIILWILFKRAKDKVEAVVDNCPPHKWSPTSLNGLYCTKCFIVAGLTKEE